MLDDLSDPSSFGDVDENDPKSVARWARKMGKEMGEEMGPEFDEMVERMETIVLHELKFPKEQMKTEKWG